MISYINIGYYETYTTCYNTYQYFCLPVELGAHCNTAVKVSLWSCCLKPNTEDICNALSRKRVTCLLT